MKNSFKCPHCYRPIETAVNWIDVNDKLPEDVYGTHRKQIQVLVSTTSGNVIMATRLQNYRAEGYHWSKDIRDCNITHWMPKPNPANK